MTRGEARQYWQFRLDNAKDYIDPHWEADERRAHREYVEALTVAIEALQDEAVQGEWVRKYDDKVNCYWYECDQCGEYRPRNQFGHEYNANFCPNCGAKMTKGGDSE